MANNCLVTKLKSSVPGNLDFLENLSFTVEAVENPDPKNYGVYVGILEGSQPITIEGDGFFTDATMTTNLGKTASTRQNLKYSNGNYVVKFPLTNIVAFTVGALNVGLMDAWTMKNINYKRLCSLNKDTLTSLVFDSYKTVLETIEYTTNVVRFDVFNPPSNYNMGSIFEKIVEQQGRTANFSYTTSNGVDYYGTTTGTRNIHIITPNTKFSVYNGADTQELFVAEKINGVWQYTRS